MFKQDVWQVKIRLLKILLQLLPTISQERFVQLRLVQRFCFAINLLRPEKIFEETTVKENVLLCKHNEKFDIHPCGHQFFGGKIRTKKV